MGLYRSGRQAQRAGRIIARKHYDDKANANGAAIKAAEDKAFKLLEKRWAAQLEGRPIPQEHRRKMRKDRFFIELAMRIAAGEPVLLDDLDHMPEKTTRIDGEVDSRFNAELNMDEMESLWCPECGEETENPGRLCQACIEFRLTGRKS